MELEPAKAKVQTAIVTLGDAAANPDLPASMADHLRAAVAELEAQQQEPLRLAIVGEFNAGKTTFLNALLGGAFLASSDTPCTPVPTYISYGAEIRRFADFGEHRAELTEQQLLEYTTEGRAPAGLRSLVLQVPAPFLARDVILVDTPGVNSTNQAHTDATHEALQHVHACLVLINARKPDAGSTRTFIERAKQHVSKMFFCVSRTDMITADQVVRVLNELPKRLGCPLERLFAIGYKQEGQADRRLVGIEEFEAVVSGFMAREWQEVRFQKIAQFLEGKRATLEGTARSELTALETAFFERYKLKPVGFFEESEAAVATVRAELHVGLPARAAHERHRVLARMTEGAAAHLAVVDAAWTKTTLAMGAASRLRKAIEDSRRHLEQGVPGILQGLADFAMGRYWACMAKPESLLRDRGEALAAKKAESAANRLHAAGPLALTLAILVFIAGALLGSQLDLEAPWRIALLAASATWFAVLTVSAVSRAVGRWLIRRRDRRIFDLDRQVRRSGEFTRNRVVAFHASEAFIQRVQKSTAVGAGAATFAAGSDHPLLAGGALLVSFLANELGGPSLAQTKATLKQETERTIYNLADTLYGVIMSVEHEIALIVEQQVKELERAYQTYLEADSAAKQLAYEVARRPLVATEALLADLTRLREDSAVAPAPQAATAANANLTSPTTNTMLVRGKIAESSTARDLPRWIVALSVAMLVLTGIGAASLATRAPPLAVTSGASVPSSPIESAPVHDSQVQDVTPLRHAVDLFCSGKVGAELVGFEPLLANIPWSAFDKTSEAKLRALVAQRPKLLQVAHVLELQANARSQQARARAGTDGLEDSNGAGTQAEQQLSVAEQQLTTMLAELGQGYARTCRQIDALSTMPGEALPAPSLNPPSESIGPSEAQPLATVPETTASAASVRVRATDVEKLVNAQAASLTGTAEAFVNSFAESAIAFFPQTLTTFEGRAKIIDGSREAWGRGAPDNVETSPVAVGIAGSVAWATTTWKITLGNPKAVMPVRVTELLSVDGNRLSVIAASFSVAPPSGSAGVAGPAPAFTLGVPATDGPESWFAKPAELAQSIGNDPATSLVGSDAKEYAVGAGAVRKLLTSWTNVKLEIVGKVRVVDGEGYKIVLAFARWSGPTPTLFRVLGLLVRGESMAGPAPWLLATVHYSVAVLSTAPASANTISSAIPGTCPNGMSSVARGTFSMGSPDGLGDANEHPSHQVTVSAFCIDTTEVTVAAYATCAGSGRCLPPGTGGSCNAGRPDRQGHPINCISWDQAVAFCSAAGKRLPTEAEWEYAARGTDGREFAWGNDLPTAQRLNACGGECTSKAPERLFTDSDGWPETAPVGSYAAGASASGALDMAGNVWEWVADWMGPYSAEAAADPKGPTSGKARAYRGGGWGGRDAGSVRAARRRADKPSNQDDSLGFRCAK